MKPFRINVPQATLDDLKQRLVATRWPERETVDDWRQGVPLAWLQDICSYWASSYNWREREAALNRFPQFTTTLDGLGIHFVHQRSSCENALPLLMTHGWPGSFVEFHKVIEPLVDPVAHGGTENDAFHVVCPSLPGFGFSDKPVASGWGVERIARAWTHLMAELGYENYLAQGGDWGSAVTACLGGLDPEHCAGIHVTLTMGTRPTKGNERSPEETRAFDCIDYYRRHGAGYSQQQSTRPQTIGYALCDSPSGLAAWILEKFWEWTDCNGHPEHVLHRDELLDNVMLYWTTNAAASSARLYWESFRGVDYADVTIPTGVAVYPREIVPPVRKWMEAGTFKNIVHWAEMARGGHFAAFEQPELFVENLRDYARRFR